MIRAGAFGSVACEALPNIAAAERGRGRGRGFWGTVLVTRSFCAKLAQRGHHDHRNVGLDHGAGAVFSPHTDHGWAGDEDHARGGNRVAG